jgi:hypothetical protein
MTRVAVAAFLLSVATAQAATHYTQEMFRRGVQQAQTFTAATGPLYVLITLRSPSGSADRAVATPAPFLLGAIDIEYHFKFPDPEHPPKNDDEIRAKLERKELQIALSRPDRVFLFRTPQARDNVELRYTPAILAYARQQLSGHSRRAIIAAVRARKSWLHRIYTNKRSLESLQAYRDAVAHALLEQGILVGQRDDYTGLWVPDNET